MWYLAPCPNSVLLLMTITHRTGQPDLGLSLWLLLGQLCHLAPCLPQLVPAMHVMEVVLLSYLWWRSAVFPGNTKSHGGQVSSLVTGMGCSQTPLHLQGHSGCLVGWGCDPPSGYLFQVSVFLVCSIWWPLTWNSGHELKLQMGSSSSVASVSERSGGSRHPHHGWQPHRETGGHMKINLPVFKDEDTKDAITYQSWC